MDARHVYDLAFVQKKYTGHHPRLVITIKARLLPTVYDRLATLERMNADHAREYLGGEWAFRLDLDTDLFGSRYVGYARCGIVNIDEAGAHFTFDLVSGGARKISLSLTLIFSALNSFARDEVNVTNESEFLSITTTAMNETVHGHAMGGEVSARMVHELSGYAKRCKHRMSYLGHTTYPLPSGVRSAMLEAWTALSPQRRRWARHAGGTIRREGMFMLTCFGNACDIAIYPDEYSEYIVTSGLSTSFGCHNLDSAEQQLTLLSGLAALSEFARNRILKREQMV